MQGEDEPTGVPAKRTTDVALTFEQYRLAVEMADRVSARRGNMNAFFVALQAALLGASEGFGLTAAGVFGIALCATWWLLIRSYRTLNAAKWAVINDIESRLPLQPFRSEWTRLKEDALKRRLHSRYAELGLAEQAVPIVLVGLYIWVIIDAVS